MSDLFAMSAAQSAAIAAHSLGYADGLAGRPEPDGPAARREGWMRGNIKRRVKAGEVLGFVCQGTLCKVCGSQNWGYRMGCECGGAVEWGVLVNDAAMQDGTPARFMSLDAANATGLPLVDVFRGDTIPTSADAEATTAPESP